MSYCHRMPGGACRTQDGEAAGREFGLSARMVWFWPSSALISLSTNSWELVASVLQSHSAVHGFQEGRAPSESTVEKGKH